MYKLEYLNDNGDWIHGGFYKNKENAVFNAEVKERGGYKTRVIYQGQIVREGE
jgi:hypothetical protein